MAIKHKIRDKHGGTKVIKLTARRAIIEHCKECMGFNTEDVRRCTATLCPLFPFKTWDRPEDQL